jgi:hypothetical protein
MSTGIAVLVVACSDPGAPGARIEVGKREVIRLSDRQSGYRQGTNWADFLACWGKGVESSRSSLLHVSVDQGQARGDNDESYDRRIASLQDRLGFKLPASYVDFLRSFRPAHASDTREDSISMFPPEDVNRVFDKYRALVDVAEDWPIESGDADYFRYGVDQDDSNGRLSYLRNAIAIGRYGDDQFEMIVLYPDSQTADGEMEASMLFHAGEFRAPSFAELMRNVSYLETRRPEGMPPYSQELLADSCSSRLRLENVWWK